MTSHQTHRYMFRRTLKNFIGLSGLHMLFAAIRMAMALLLVVLAPADCARAAFQLEGAPGLAACGPHAAGSTCGSVGPAAQGSDTGVQVGAGNPINVINGNKTQREVDLPALPGELGLEIVRHYNSSASMVVGQIGAGWRLSYETDLHVVGNSIQILQADGARRIFARDPAHPSWCASPDPAHGRVLARRSARGEEYTWEWPDGRKLLFNTRGKLEQIVSPSGAFVTLTRGPRGELLKVTDPQGRELRMRYPEPGQARRQGGFAGIIAIDSPLGQFRYEHGSEVPEAIRKDHAADHRQAAALRVANLVKVSYPTHYDGDRKPHPYAAHGITVSTLSRSYHYEDAAAGRHAYLTGIGIIGSGSDGKLVDRRLSTWAYDKAGHAVMSTHEHDAGKITLAFVSPSFPGGADGKTVLTDRLGRQTTYRHRVIGGEYRLLEVTGTGCDSCGDANVRYGYDRIGRLTDTTRLDARGRPATSRRIERDVLGRIVKISDVEYRNGKAVAPRWRIRYAYEGSGVLPASIVRPSVVPGREFQVRLEYNRFGQAVSVRESGFSPLDEAGREQATPITRVTAYRYDTINGKSLLAGIAVSADSADMHASDAEVTSIAYDAQGKHPLRILRPGGQRITVSRRDAAGRPAVVTMQDEARTIRTDLAYTLSGKVQELTQRAWLADDASTPANDDVAAPPQALVRKLAAQYDAADILSAIALPTVSFATLAPDPADRSDVANDESKDANPSPARAAGYRMQFGEPGSMLENQPIGITLPDDAHSRLSARRWLDDFGRLVGVRYGRQDMSRARYVGASQRIASIIDPTGAVTQLGYDTQGRLASLVRSDAQGRLSERIVFRHLGQWLVAQEKFPGSGQGSPDSAIRMRYNAFGQVTQEMQQLGGQSVAVNHDYDETGRLGKTWLTQLAPDGETIDLPAVHMRHATSPGLSDRLDAIDVGSGWIGTRVVVRNLQWMPAVATGWQYGNGLRVRAAVEPTGNQRWPWRLHAYHDGVHAYGISTDEDGRIDRIVQQPVDPALAKGAHVSAAVANPSMQESGMPGSTPFPAIPAPWSPDAERPVDAAGRYLTHPVSGEAEPGRLELVWNAAGQLERVRQAGKDKAIYRYDAQGRRIAKALPDDPAAGRRFIYDGRQLIAETDANGLVTKQFIYLGWRPVAWMEPARTFVQRLRQFFLGPRIIYLHSDHRGAVTAATDEEAKLLWRAGVDGNGKLIIDAEPNAPIEQPLRLVNQYADPETGLNYNLARYYDPQAGRFISPDPAGLDGGGTDLYAYAGGDMLNAFDPDGWAKVSYFAITAQANGISPIGVSQGFTKARWAFVISDIQGGAKENLLFDPTGNFVKGKLDYSTRKGDAFGWNKNEESFVGDPVQLLKQFYGKNLISISEFNINNFNDEQARAILSRLGYADSNEAPNCAVGILPPIQFGFGDPDINVMMTNYSATSKQRILNCNPASQFTLPFQSVEERRRIAKYEAAAELNESPAPPAVEKDCSANGCPGMAVVINGHTYHASYGRTQFVGETFLRALQSLVINNADVPPASMRQLGITGDVASRIQAALRRSGAVGRSRGFFETYRARFGTELTSVQREAAWAGLTMAERHSFQDQTGFGEQEFIDMLSFHPAGAITIGEGRNAFMTQAIFTDEVLRNWLLAKFKSTDEYSFISKLFLMANLRTIENILELQSQFRNDERPFSSEWKSRQRAIEENLAARIARLHNGGVYRPGANQLPRSLAFHPDESVLTRQCTNQTGSLCDINGRYVANFLGLVQGRGDWRSLRCSDNLTNNVGLEVTPLKIN
ncbi:RHS repeat-associated core domain-containing protein [Noviherbaspirillum galbum]|uniref:RHS repeat-associated core domain-containing protein n=1 Tax=Noviherbaspirillum galbum TaxID=2709383 RepID=A0A6B3SSY1_9BURK|nr:RHS repeat-associated core domain-containing protein [Noviherbaspirillum galbum]NEX62455.1 RHS repeat-associated core domain-containing protein [Noviherbaspirillum galbum]